MILTRCPIIVDHLIGLAALNKVIPSIGSESCVKVVGKLSKVNPSNKMN
jgi:hypothetical protein